MCYFQVYRKVIQLYIYYIYIYIYIYIMPQFFSIIGCYTISNIVPVLYSRPLYIAYSCHVHSSAYMLISNSLCAPPSFTSPFSIYNFAFYVCACNHIYYWINLFSTLRLWNLKLIWGYMFMILLKIMNNNLLCSRGNSTQYSVITYARK